MLGGFNILGHGGGGGVGEIVGWGLCCCGKLGKGGYQIMGSLNGGLSKTP